VTEIHERRELWGGETRKAIDAHECGLGGPLGKPRVKLCSWDALLAAAAR
jgi:hypothetical protein